MNGFDSSNANNFNPFEVLNKVKSMVSIPGLENLNPIPWWANINQAPWLEKLISDTLGFSHNQQIINSQYGIFKTDVFETSDEVIVKAVIPGLEKPNDASVKLKGMELQIEANVPETVRDAGHEKIITHKFSRNVKLPVMVKDFGASANYKNGILEIKLPKEYLPQTSRNINIQFL